MDLNFELILTVIFLISAAVFWLLNKFMVKQAEGTDRIYRINGPSFGSGVGVALFCYRALSDSIIVNGANPKSR